MKHHQTAALGLLLLALFVGTADAQKKTTKKTTVKKPVAAVLPPLEIRAAREKVVIQRDNVNRFIDVLGPIAVGIETLDESARTKPLARATADKNAANKQNVVTAIRNLSAGLADLETQFRTKPELLKYLPNIQGITDLAAQSEDMAIAGKFVASKEPLRIVVRRLMDTLAKLPYSPPGI